jgi:hypothetical protein
MRRRRFMATLAAIGLSRTLTRAAHAQASLREGARKFVASR